MKSVSNSGSARLILLVLFMLLMTTGASFGNSTDYEDVVYLKNGGIIRGVIIEQIPGQSLKIQTRDGNVFVYKLDEIDRFTKEPTKVRQLNANSPGKKSGGTAFVLSLLIPGGGQFYNGQGGKGAIMLGLSVVGAALIISGSEGDPYYDYYRDSNSGDETKTGLGAFLLVGSALWSLIDAPISASAINRKNGYASGVEISNGVFVDVGLKNKDKQHTPYLQASINF